jgi:hypothetical protein
MRALYPCGTKAAYDRHLLYHQVPCADCTAAKRRHDTACRRGRAEQAALFRQLLGLLAGVCREEGMLP